MRSVSGICLILIGLCNSALAQKDTAKKGQVLLFPVVAKSIETGWSFGGAGSITFHLTKKDTTTRTSNLQLLGLYSLKQQLVLAVNGAQYTKNEGYILNEQVSFSSFPDKFWGIGQDTPDSNQENYDFQQYYIYLHLMRNLGHNLFIGAAYEFQDVTKVDYVPGGLFDKQHVVGRNGYRISGLGLSFTYDDRNNAFSPDRGLFAQLYLNHFDKTFGSDFNYNNIVVDVRKYIPVTRRTVLALQAFAFGNTGNEVPLRSLASFGGSNSMRGYYDGRYRDKQQLIFQAEYRFPIYKRFSGVVFTGGGNVGNAFRDIALADLKYSFGGGLRFALNKSEKLNLRLDYGVGQGNNSGLYFQLGEAF